MASNGRLALPAKRIKHDRSQSAGDLPPPTFDLDTWASNYDSELTPVNMMRFATADT